MVSADIADRARAGVVAGLFGGFAFALANMWFAGAHGKPSVAPFLSISTIFHGQDVPVMSAQNVVIGLVLHIALSMLFGLVFGLLVVPLLRTTTLLVAGAIVYGLGLFVVNFEIFGRTLFPWFSNPKGPNMLFELWIHPVAFGLFLIPFFLTNRRMANHDA